MHFKIKEIKGRKYLYIIKNQWVNGAMKQTIQKCIGNADHVYKLASCKDHAKILSFSFGKTAAILHASERLGFLESVNRHIKRRDQDGLSVGEYLLLLIIGRTEGARSRRKMESWFHNSALRFLLTPKHSLSAQNCLNYMNRLTDTVIENIEKDLAGQLIQLGFSPLRLIFDTTNTFTYIEKGETIPKKGHSKQKRFDKNLIGVALTVSDNNIPFHSEVYPGNEHDADVFVRVFNNICKRLEELKVNSKDITLVFDKGINSDINIKNVTEKMHIVGSIPRDEAKNYLVTGLEEFTDLYKDHKDNMVQGKRFDDEEFFGKNYTIVVMYNKASYTRQKETYERYRQKILDTAGELQRKTNRKGRGKKLTLKGATNQLVDAIPKQYRGIFNYGVEKKDQKKELQITCEVIPEKEEELYRSFGKNTLFTDNKEWSTTQIVQAYNSKSEIEDDFKWLNDKVLIPLKPYNVRKDVSIRAHVFLCMVGLLLYRFILTELQIKKTSPATVAEKLDKIRIALLKRGRKAEFVVEEMPREIASIFSTLRLDRFLPK